MHDEKYVVFKADVIYDFVQECRKEPLEEIDEAIEAWKVDDAVVIRRQDVFSPPALDSYANSILAAVEVLQNSYEGGLPPDVYGTVRRLRGIADYFHNQARDAWAGTEKKVPD